MDGSNEHFMEVMGAVWAGVQSCVGSITADGGHATSHVDQLGKAEDTLWEDQLSPAYRGITTTINENVDRFEIAVNYFLEGDHLMEMSASTGGRSVDVLTAPEVTQNGEVVHDGGYIYYGNEEPTVGSPEGPDPDNTGDGPNNPSTSPFSISPED